MTISQENKVLLRELKGEVLTIKHEAKELSVSLFIQLKAIFIQFLISYKEYSLTNIREYGLGEILMDRAMRFFKLESDRREKKKEVTKLKRTKKGRKYLLKRGVKIILYPFYIIILLLELAFKLKSKKINNKSVRNVYRE